MALSYGISVILTPGVTLTMSDPHSHSSHCLRLPDSSCRPENSWLVPGKGATSWPELFLCLPPHLCPGGAPCHLLARVEVGRVLHTKSKGWLLLWYYGLQQGGFDESSFQGKKQGQLFSCYLIFIRCRCDKLLRILQLTMHGLGGAIILACRLVNYLINQVLFF